MGSKIIHKKEPTPLLVLRKNHAVSVQGWRYHAVEEHLRWHMTQPEDNRWCEIKCMARTIFARNTLDNCERVRRRLPKLFRAMCDQDWLLVIDHSTKKDEHGRAKRMKLYESDGVVEKQNAEHQLDRMAKRMDLTKAYYEKALSLL